MTLTLIFYPVGGVWWVLYSYLTDVCVCVCVFSSVCVHALEVTVSQSSVQVARGQAAVLPCTFSTSAALNNLYIIWMVTPLANANQPEQVINQTTHRYTDLNHTHMHLTSILCSVLEFSGKQFRKVLDYIHKD